MYVNRDIKDDFEKIAAAYEIVALVGPRQAGKTTFLKERVKGINADYLMFDDPDVLELFNLDIKRFENQYLEGYELAALDEVQYGAEAGRKLKYLADKERKIWITSSSQTVLGKEVLSWLVGRVSVVQLYPFSLREFLRSRGIKEQTEKITKRAIWEHLTYGGYPKVVLTSDISMKRIILKDLYETMVLKDIAKTFSIDDIRSLETFCKYLSHSVGHMLIYGKVSSDLDLSFQTVKKYLDAMEKSYLIIRTLPFFTNKLKEITKQPKIYFIDTGLRNTISNDFPSKIGKKGKLFENYVLCELLKIGFTPKYWQTKSKAEVDFVVEEEAQVIPIEVKVNAPTRTVERSLRSFIRTYKPKLALVVFYDGIPSQTIIDGCKVIFTDVAHIRDILK
jgi:predicted AAA+ superfamily ATPase